MRRPVTVVLSGTSIVVLGLALRAGRPLPVAYPVTAPVRAAAAPAPGLVHTVPGSPPAPRPHLPSAAAVAAPVRRSASPRPRTAVVTAPPQPSAVAAAPRPTKARSTAPSARPTPATTTTVDGGSADTPYGPVQVQIAVRNHRIVRADAVVYPQDTDRARSINEQAVPQLDQETLSAQSAQIDTVSGATYTSNAYRASLQSAIDAASRAGLL